MSISYRYLMEGGCQPGCQSFGSDKDGVAGTRITADVGGGWMSSGDQIHSLVISDSQLMEGGCQD